MSWQAFGHVINLKLPAEEKWLLVCLSNHADVWGDSIFPSLDTLAEEAGMSRSTVRRSFQKLLTRGALEQLAFATPVSPAFYRIVGVPEPTELVRAPQCPMALRRAVIHAFQFRCEYCGKVGTKELGADDKPWNVDRVVPGKRGGIYTPDNVTLACRACNAKKKSRDAVSGIRSLAEIQRQQGGCQIDTSLESEGGVNLDPPGFQSDTGGGVNLTPESVLESVLEFKAGAAPRLIAEKPISEKTPDRPGDNYAVILKIAHEALDRIGDCPILIESVKTTCARLHIAYDSGTVRAAVDSALWQRRQRSREG